VCKKKEPRGGLSGIFIHRRWGTRTLGGGECPSSENAVVGGNQREKDGNSKKKKRTRKGRKSLRRNSPFFQRA